MKVTVVVHGNTNTDLAQEINVQVNQMEDKPAFYCVSTCGLYGWAYVDLGAFTYNFTEPGNAGVTLSETVRSANFSDFLD